MLNSKIPLKSKSSQNRQKEGALTTYYKVLNYLLKDYATNDVIAETFVEIMRLTQLLNKTPIEYTQLLWAKALRWDRKYSWYVQNLTLLKAYKVPSGRECFHYGVQTAIQAYKPDATRNIFD